MLRVYSENDSFFAPALAASLYNAFTRTGGECAGCSIRQRRTLLLFRPGRIANMGAAGRPPPGPPTRAIARAGYAKMRIGSRTPRVLPAEPGGNPGCGTGRWLCSNAARPRAPASFRFTRRYRSARWPLRQRLRRRSDPGRAISRKRLASIASIRMWPPEASARTPLVALGRRADYQR